MRSVSHDVIWVDSQIGVIFSDDALKRSRRARPFRPWHAERPAALRHVTRQDARSVLLTHVSDTTYAVLES